MMTLATDVIVGIVALLHVYITASRKILFVQAAPALLGLALVLAAGAERL